MKILVSSCRFGEEIVVAPVCLDSLVYFYYRPFVIQLSVRCPSFALPLVIQLVMKFMRFGVFFSFSPPLSRFICKILTSDNLIKLKAISRRTRQIGKMTCRNNKKGNFLGTTDKKFQKRLWANYWLIMRPNYCTWSYDDVVARNRTTNWTCWMHVCWKVDVAIAFMVDFIDL